MNQEIDHQKKHLEEVIQHRAHLGSPGSHCEVLRGVCNQGETRELVERIRTFMAENQDKMVWIDLYCSSGRHRSVALSVITGVLLCQLKVPFVIAHLNGVRWQEMRCGGRCDQCKMTDLQATLNAVRPIFGQMVVRDFIKPREPEVIEESAEEAPAPPTEQ